MKIIPDFECTEEVREKFNETLEGVAPLIRKKAKKLSDQIGEPLDDVEQWFRMILMSAMHRFDPQKGVKFSTYFYRALSNSAPMVLSYYQALKRTPHIVVEGKSVRHRRENGTIKPKQEAWDGEEPAAGYRHTGQWLKTNENPEVMLMETERKRNGGSFRQGLTQQLIKPIDKRILSVIMDPPDELLELASGKIKGTRAVGFIAKYVGVSQNQAKISLARINDMATKLFGTTNNKDTETQNQSWIGEILSGGDEMAKEENGNGKGKGSEDTGCLGFYDEGDATCNGDATAKSKDDQAACGQKAECLPIAKAAKLVAEAEGTDVESLIKLTMGDEAAINELLEKGSKLQKKTKGKKAGGKKGKGKKAKPEAVEEKKEATETEKEPEAKEEKPKETTAKKGKKAKPEPEAVEKEEPEPEAEKATEKEEATEPEEPKEKKPSGLSDPNNPSRVLAIQLFKEIGEVIGKPICADKSEAENDGDLFIIDKTPVAGGGSAYMTMYSHRIKGKKQGIVIAYLKPRNETIDVGVACGDKKALQKASPGIDTVKETPSDGMFKLRIMGIESGKQDVVVMAVKNLIAKKVIQL